MNVHLEALRQSIEIRTSGLRAVYRRHADELEAGLPALAADEQERRRRVIHMLRNPDCLSSR